MKPEELNTALRMEIIHYRETDEITNELKLFIMELILAESKKRLSIGSDNIKILCEARAYIDCCKHCIHYNPDKSDNAYGYIMQLIRCAFALEIAKNG